MMENNRTDFYDYLRSQFSDLESAIAWARTWYRQGQPVIKGFGEFTCRAMAGHISMALEGKPNECGIGIYTDYMSTKYGVEIFWGMFENK
jgi:hypothetical protein